MSADEMLILLILAAYFGLLLIGCWVAGQLIILIIDYMADRFERHKKRAA